MMIIATAYAGAQGASRTVAVGVYTQEQAERGAVAYETSCSMCHQPDLSGGQGPSLKEQRFARDFAGKSLRALYSKISSSMPRNDPGTLGEPVYLDIVAHVLKENGFPAGQQELQAEGIDAIQVVAGKPKPPPPVGSFSYVEVVGCLTPGPDNTWLLTQGSEPVVVSPAPGAPVAAVKPLGTQTFHLLDAMAYTPEVHRGQKMSVRGLLIKLPDEQRMTISSISTVAPTCSE